MNRFDKDRLLREILADENLERLREASLERGLASLRARRRRRAVLPSIAAVAALAAILAVLFPRQGRNATRIAASDPLPATSLSKVKVIDDEQLLALFPDRAVALIGAPGNQKLVFLDSAVMSIAAEKNR
jgi:hypothetical protein